MNKSHEPELLRQLRQKSLELQIKLDKLTLVKKQNSADLISLQQQLNSYSTEKQVQERKYKSLILLLNQLQKTYHETYLDEKNNQKSQEKLLRLENSFLRHILIKQTENTKEMQKLQAFLKQLQMNNNRTKTKGKEFIKRSNYIESQAEAIAKLKASINSFRNQNLQCKRKWFKLQEETKNLENDSKLLKIQIQRQKMEIKEQYENYLDRINDSKTRIVHFNETQRQNSITEYFVKQIAVLQQKRQQIEEKNNNLAYHYENLNQESERISMENRQLTSFFHKDGQQSKLAEKMKKRIDELRDTFIELKKRNKNSRIAKLTQIVQYIRGQLLRFKESNDFMEMRVREQEEKGVSLEHKPIAEFFTKILEQKDLQLVMIREKQASLQDKKKELAVAKQVMKNQIQHLEENLEFNNYQRNYGEKQLWEKGVRDGNLAENLIQETQALYPFT